MWGRLRAGCAYVLVNAESGRLWEVAQNVRKIQGVRMSHAVTGLYDVIVFVEFTHVQELRRLIGAIQSIEGVVGTHTAMATAQRLADFEHKAVSWDLPWISIWRRETAKHMQNPGNRSE